MNAASETAGILVWNLQRKELNSEAAAAQVETIKTRAPDISVLTETWIGWSDILGGNEVSAFGAVWSPTHADERKILLWSAKPWKDPEWLAFEGSPVGRIVAATTETPIGSMRVVGVCIPYHGANMRRKFNPAPMWWEHRHYLMQMIKFIGGQSKSIPLVIAGDFNQRIPGKFAPKELQASLIRALAGTTLHTSGEIGEERIKLIDHCATTDNLALEELNLVHAPVLGGTAVSDHTGVIMRISRRD